MADIKVYSTETCPFCVKAKEWLKENDHEYEEINVQADPSKAQEMFEKSGQMGVPVIDIKGQIIVGFDPHAMQEALKN